MSAKDDLVKIEPGGRIEPVGASAALRLQGREGLFRVFPAPPHVVFMREQSGEAPSDARVCRLSGEITTPSELCDIVGFLGQTGWRGELMVFDDAGTRSIFIEQGNVVNAQSSVTSERLGTVLYRYGILTEPQVDECLAAAAATMRFGEAAVKLGYVTREKLFELMGTQSEEIVYGALLVAHGVFYFLADFDEARISSRQVLPVSTLVRQAVRRMHEMRYFGARIPTPQHVPVLTGAPVTPESDALGLARVIDGRRSVAELCRHCGAGEFEVTRAVFALVHQGAVAIRPPTVTAPEAIAICNEAVTIVLRELDAMDQGDVMRKQLADFARRGALGRLLSGITPSDDGALDPERVLANLAGFPPGDRADEHLATWLREYAAYALFLSRPHVARAAQARAVQEGSARPPRLSQRVGALLERITDATKNGGPV